MKLTPLEQDGAFLKDAERSLAQAQTIGEIKSVRDKADAMRQYATRAGLGLQVQNLAAKIKLLAEWKIGTLLVSLHLHGGNRKTNHVERLKLEELGISRNQSAKWQREASVPWKVLQQYLREALVQGREPTSAGLLSLAEVHRSILEASQPLRNVFEVVAMALRRIADERITFGCLYAAPPWHGIDMPRNGSSMHHPEIVRRLAKLPVKTVIRPDSHVYLAITPDAMGAALNVLRAWGFHCVSSLVLSNSPADTGRCWQSAHTVLLLGVRGRLPLRQNTLSIPAYGVLETDADQLGNIRNVLQCASPGPYLDLFGTNPALGWRLAAGKNHHND